MPLLKCWIFLIYPLMTGRKEELQNRLFVVGGEGGERNLQESFALLPLRALILQVLCPQVFWDL